MNSGPVYAGDQAVPHLAAESRVTRPAPPCVCPGPVAVVPAIGICRSTLHSSGLGCIEDFSAPGDYPAPCGHSPEYQLVFPYAGAFEWHVGARTVFLDGTRVLFVGAGEDYADVHVAGHGHDSIIITPHLSLLQELSGHAVPSRHFAFRCVTKPTTPRMNLRNHRLLRLDTSGNDPLASDELMIALLDEALGPTERVVRASPLHVVDAAKQFLHAHLCEPISLDEIAHAVQVSGAYLTDAFTRSEGVPLCQYRMRLRLNRALVDLPSCEDITGLALDLGFSSHAHFSNAFKSLFGVSPSAFRAGCGKPRRAVRIAPGSRAGGAPAERRGGTPTQKS
jgi:AraC family transcriptional regulator